MFYPCRCRGVNFHATMFPAKKECSCRRALAAKLYRAPVVAPYRSQSGSSFAVSKQPPNARKATAARAQIRHRLDGWKLVLLRQNVADLDHVGAHPENIEAHGRQMCRQQP